MKTDTLRAGLAPLGGGVILLLLCALGAMLDVRGFLAAWLAAWWFWAGLALGAQATLWLHRLTGGVWIIPIAIPLNRLRAAVPAVGILVLPVLLWPGSLYPWAAAGWVDTASEQTFRHAWFTPAGMAFRVIVCVVLWSVLARLDGSGRGRARRTGYAAAGLLIFAFTISIAAVDLLMSLTPQWYSTAFGLLVLTAQLKAAMAAAACAGARRASEPLRGDLGNLLLTYVMSWAYIAFTQFQIIWAENLPAEISWYVPRMQGPWIAMGVALVLAGFAVPQVALLFRGLKRSAAGLRTLAILLLIVSLCETTWWVFPSAGPVSWHAVWMLLLAVGGMGLIVRATAILFPTLPPPAPAPVEKPGREQGTGATQEGRRKHA
jgi:hypothetical protein